MSNLNIQEITLADAQKRTDCVIEAKIDGSGLTWDGKTVRSERDIDRNARFPHVVSELRRLDWDVQGEIAVPFSNVLVLNKSESWAKTRFYVFGLNKWKGQDWSGASYGDKRRKLAEIFKANNFADLRIPFAWDSFDTAWDFVKRKDLEGLVLKPKNDNGKIFKIKYLKEAKLPIVGFEQGKLHGKFLLLCANGEIGGCSALSVGNVAKYKAMLAANEKPYAEIEYMFLTPDKAIPFQPRLRRLDTLTNLQTS